MGGAIRFRLRIEARGSAPCVQRTPGVSPLRSAVAALDEVGVGDAEGASDPVTRRQTTDVLPAWVTEGWS